MKQLIEKYEAMEKKPEEEIPDAELTEAERVQKANIVKAADAMVGSPMATRYLTKLGMSGYEMQLQQTIEAMLIQMLQMRGVGVSGGSQALKAIRGLGRGMMPGE